MEEDAKKVRRALRLDYIKQNGQPYRAEYLGWTTLPVHPRLGLGGITGYNSRTYGFLMRTILHDLIVYPDNEEFPVLMLSEDFSREVGPDLKRLTIGLLSKGVLEKLKDRENDLSDLIKVL